MKMNWRAQTHISAPPKQGLYDPQFEHDACGVGFRRQHQGQKIPRAGHCRAANSGEPRPSRRVGCEPNTGDGAGILDPDAARFFQKVADQIGFKLPAFGQYGVGMLFMPKNPAEREGVKDALAKIISDEGQTLLGWRDVPTDNSSLGKTARNFRAVHDAGFRRTQSRRSRTTRRSNGNFTSSAKSRSKKSVTAEKSRAENGFTFPACRRARAFTKAC